jgi:hypothetical protein
MRILGVTASGFNIVGDYELISTTILPSNAPSVTFDVSSFAFTYKHLQIRFTGRSASASTGQELTIRVNGVSTNSYSWHFLRGTGSIVQSEAGSTTNGMYLGQFSAASATANHFTSGVIDLLDPYSTTKNKTFRGFSGISDPSLTRILLYSGLFQSTNAVDSITIFSQNFTDNIVAGSRFSLYGIRG